MKAALLRRLAIGVLVAATAAPVAAQGDLGELQAQIAEARRRFEALDYEQAVPALDRVISILTTRRTDDTRRQLAESYELRARSRFGLNDQTGAREDFTSMLRVDASRTLTGQISPRVVAIFDEVRSTTVTSATLNVSPSNAEVMLDGQLVAANVTIPVLVGDHTLTARRIGYRSDTATFSAAPGAVSEVALNLTRESAVVTLVTSPPDVDIFVDGVSRGKTAVGPPSNDYADRASRAGIPMAQLSAVFTIADLAVGNHRVEFRKGCFVTIERTLNVSRLDDIPIEPIKLLPAVATVISRATQTGATVFIDGEDKGPAPVTAELCEGEHTVELRAPNGRYTKRVDARAGQRVEVTGDLRPAFALVSAGAQGALGSDLRVVVERALEPVRSVLVFAPPADAVDRTLRASQLPQDWLTYDSNKRPLGTSAEINPPMRRDLSTRISKAFDAQGVASVSVPSAANRNRLVVSLLSAGAAVPDVFEIVLDRPETIADAVTQLDRPIALMRPSLGLSVIDVADVPGAVVVAVDANGNAAKAAVQAGDVIIKAGDQPVADGAALAAILATKTAADSMVLEIKDRMGSPKKADIKIVMTPRLIGMNDETLLANRVLLELKTRLMAPANPVEESILRLNAAAALARLQAWSDARTELQKVRLPEGPGVGNGTVQFLLGLCAENLGNRAEAETAYRTAASSESYLSEDGPPVKGMAESKLAELQRRAGR